MIRLAAAGEIDPRFAHLRRQGSRPFASTGHIFDPEVDSKYRKLSFTPADLSVELTVGRVSVYAVGHGFKGVMLTFESIARRSMCQYEVSLPTKCSVERIAGLIYLNVLQNFPGSVNAFKAHFESVGIPLFQ